MRTSFGKPFFCRRVPFSKESEQSTLPLPHSYLVHKIIESSVKNFNIAMIKAVAPVGYFSWMGLILIHRRTTLSTIKICRPKSNGFNTTQHS